MSYISPKKLLASRISITLSITKLCYFDDAPNYSTQSVTNHIQTSSS